MNRHKKAWLRTLSALSVNFAAALFILAFITPNFTDVSRLKEVATLTYDILFGILFLLISVKIESELS